MNFDLGLGAGLDQPSFFEVSAHERVVPTLHSAFDRQTLHAPRLALGQVLAHLPVALLHT
jgi:maltooligosyltrehalose synthase